MIADSLLSVFAVILLGYALRRWLLPSDVAWDGVERLTYYVLFPALIAKTLADARLGDVPFVLIAATLIGANLLLFFALLAARRWLERYAGISGPAFTSLVQGSLRWNTFIALAIAGNLHGALGVTIASVALASMMPLLNFQSVWVLRRHGSGGGGSFWGGLARNPFIQGTALGLALNLSGLALPPVLPMVLDILGRCALGVGLLLVGAGLNLREILPNHIPVLLGLGLRLLLLPLLGMALATLLGLSGPIAEVVIICLGVPAASAAYVLARQMGGDAPLMSAILAAQTIVSAVTLPALLAFLR